MARKPDCTLRFEGADVPAVAGEPIAVALAAAGTRVLSRSIKYHRPRSFFCLAGHCGACLMRVGGVPNVKSCRAPAAEGLVVERQNAFPSASFDVLGAADFFFPKGMDHHHLLTSSRSLNAVLRKVVREVGGLGRLPDEAALGVLPRSRRVEVEVAVIGGGPAGLSAAISCARAGHRVLVIDEQNEPGGSLLSHPGHGPAAAAALVDRARTFGVEVRPRAAAVGYYPEDDGGVLAVDDGGALLRLRAARWIYATGGYDVNLPFTDNDRPGIAAGRAVGLLLVRHGVRAGEQVAVVGGGSYARTLAEALEAAGSEVIALDGVRDQVLGARGHTWVSGLDVETDGRRRRVRCDAVAVCAPPSPASELCRHHGAEVLLRAEAGGFACVVDDAGRTTRPHVYATGDVTGAMGPDAALLDGRRVGEHVARSF